MTRSSILKKYKYSIISLSLPPCFLLSLLVSFTQESKLCEQTDLTDSVTQWTQTLADNLNSVDNHVNKVHSLTLIY